MYEDRIAESVVRRDVTSYIGMSEGKRELY